MTESRPAGFEQAPETEDPGRPGVKLSELRRGPRRLVVLGSSEQGWWKWVLIGLLILILLPVAVWLFGVIGIVIGLLVAMLIVLGAILARLGKR